MMGYELSPGGWDAIGFALLMVGAALGVWLYFLPAFIADRRNHPDFRYLLAVNGLLGWTVLGWFAALLWAIAEPSPRLEVRQRATGAAAE